MVEGEPEKITHWKRDAKTFFVFFAVALMSVVAVLAFLLQSVITKGLYLWQWTCREAHRNTNATERLPGGVIPVYHDGLNPTFRL